MAVKNPDDEPETASGLPASIEAAWGLRERPARGPKPALSLERIVAAAVDVAAAEGIGAVSMGRVAPRARLVARCRSTATSRPRTNCSR